MIIEDNGKLSRMKEGSRGEEGEWEEENEKLVAGGITRRGVTRRGE